MCLDCIHYLGLVGAVLLGQSLSNKNELYWRCCRGTAMLDQCVIFGHRREVEETCFLCVYIWNSFTSSLVRNFEQGRTQWACANNIPPPDPAH